MADTTTKDPKDAAHLPTPEVGTTAHTTIVATPATTTPPVASEAVATTASPTPEAEPPYWLIVTLRTLAYGIPLAFLAYVLYWNFLPFGYEKTFTIDVGSEGDTSGEFYLEPSRDLSERKTAEDGTTYRELNGIAYAVFKPKAVLKDAEITVEVEGEGVEIIPPVIDFDPNSVEWDYSWDFTQGKTPEELGLTGNAFPFDGAMYFDGKSRLELPDSADKFEDGPFTVYAEWTPTNDQDDFQQIVGHYNWELLQNSDSVSFQVGRMSNQLGSTYSVELSVEKDFFGIPHNAIVVYSPASSGSDDGYIELFIDNKFISRSYFHSDTILTEYGDTNLSFGKSIHGVSSYLSANLHYVSVAEDNILFQTQKLITVPNDNLLYIPVISKESARFNKVKLNVNSK